MDIILEKYKVYLEKLASTKSEEIFTNGGKMHASILMSILFKNTQKEARIFCEGFKPDLIMTTPYWDELKNFLKSRKSLHVMIENDDYLDKEPLKLLKQFNERRGNDGSIVVKKIKEEDKLKIFSSLNTNHCNFAVFDDNKFRLEYDPEKYQAIGSFNHKEYSNNLISLFDSAFESAKRL